MTKLVVVVRYELDESEDSPVADRVSELYGRLSGVGDGLLFVAIGEPCDRISAAVDAEEASANT